MHQVKSTEQTERVRMEARLPVSIRNHGAAAPNPAELMPARPHWNSPLNPLRGLLPSRPPGEAGGGSHKLPGDPNITLKLQPNFTILK
jgi:hypothetical protein